MFDVPTMSLNDEAPPNLSTRSNSFADDYGEEDPLLQRTPYHDDLPQDGHVEKKHLSGTTSTFFNVTKCFVGAASFELPFAFLKAGWLGGIIGILLLGILSYYTILILAQCGYLVAGRARPTYPMIGKAALGWTGWVLAWFGIIAMTAGVVGSYLGFIGSTISEFLQEWPNADKDVVSAFTPQLCTMLFAVPMVGALSLLRSYRFLAPTSVFGIIALLASVGIALYDGFTYTEGVRPIDTYPKFAPFANYGSFLGNAAFLYLIHSVVLPVEQTMRNRKQFKWALRLSMIVVTVGNVIFALLAMFCFFPDVKGNIVKNMRAGPVKTAVLTALSLDLLFTGALFLFPVVEGLERAFLIGQPWSKARMTWMRNGLRLTLVLLAGGLAVGIPNFEQITGFSGGFGNNVLGFILPPVFYCILKYKRSQWKFNNIMHILELVLCALIFVFGVFMLVFSTYTVIAELFKPDKLIGA